jgi:hypothetical protein
MIATLQRGQARLSERIECLTRNEDAIADYLETVLSVRSANAESTAAVSKKAPRMIARGL